MRILVTRPREQAAAFVAELQSIGADPIYLPTITIKPADDLSLLDKALLQLDKYAWLVLTSANAAQVVLDRMAAIEISTLPYELRVAAIGPKTAAKLTTAGISPDYVPDQYIAEAIITGLGELTGSWVLLPTADIAHDTLPKAIQAAHGIPHVITVYHTELAKPDAQGLAELTAGVDVITFTSGSTVQNFFILCRNADIDALNLPCNPVIACIGPKTAQTAQDMGFRVDIIADPHTTTGLVASIKSISEQEPRQ